MNTQIKKDITKISRDKVKMEYMLEEIESNIYLLMRSFHSINILEDNENENRFREVREVVKVSKSGELKNIKTKKNKNVIENEYVKESESESDNKGIFNLKKTKKKIRKKRQKIVWNSWIIDTSSESSDSEFY